jgi:hypothetical protein
MEVGPVDLGEKLYPVGIVSRRTGLSPRQLRYYEGLGLVAPARRGNRRLYSEADIALLIQIRRRREAGERPSAMAQKGVAVPALARSVEEDLEDLAQGEWDNDVRATPLGRRPTPSLYPLRERRELEARLDRYTREEEGPTPGRSRPGRPGGTPGSPLSPHPRQQRKERFHGDP